MSETHKMQDLFYKIGEMGYSLWLTGTNTVHPPSVQSCSIHAAVQCMAAHCCTPVNRRPGAMSLWCLKSSECGAHCWTHCTETHRKHTQMWNVETRNLHLTFGSQKHSFQAAFSWIRSQKRSNYICIQSASLDLKERKLVFSNPWFFKSF